MGRLQSFVMLKQVVPTYLSACLPACLLTTYLPTYLSVHLSIYLSIYPPIHLFIWLYSFYGSACRKAASYIQNKRNSE
jgi:hypothetical protein